MSKLNSNLFNEISILYFTFYLRIYKSLNTRKINIFEMKIVDA